MGNTAMSGGNDGESASGGGPKTRVDDAVILRTIRGVEEPVATGQEVAEVLGYSRRGMSGRLARLRERALVDRSDAGANAVVWWVTDRGRRLLAGEDLLQPAIVPAGANASADRSPVWTANQIAERVDLGRTGVGYRLRKMHELGLVEKKKVGGRAAVWWPTDAGREQFPGDGGLVAAIQGGQPRDYTPVDDG